jgi:hypothetical protein
MSGPLDVVDDEDFDGDADSIEEFMRGIYPDIFSAAYDEVNGAGSLPVEVAFDVTNPHVKKAIDKLATRIRGVADTTKDDIRGLVSKALDGEYDAGADRTVIPSNKEIAQRIRDQGDIDSVSRSEMIARTETATGMNLGATYAYEDAGVSEVDVMDGDDDEECASADGQTWSLDDARDSPIAHPNCTRAFSPVVK